MVKEKIFVGLKNKILIWDQFASITFVVVGCWLWTVWFALSIFNNSPGSLPPTFVVQERIKTIVNFEIVCLKWNLGICNSKSICSLQLSTIYIIYVLNWMPSPKLYECLREKYIQTGASDVDPEFDQFQKFTYVSFINALVLKSRDSNGQSLTNGSLDLDM